MNTSLYDSRKAAVAAALSTVAFALMLGTSPGNRAQASEQSLTIAPGEEFNSSAVGVSLNMPIGINGAFDEASGTIGFGNSKNSLGGLIFGGSAGGVQAGASRAVQTLLPQLELEIVQVFEDRVDLDGSIVSRFIAGNNSGITVFVQLNVHQGAAGNYVAILGNGMTSQQAEISVLVSDITNSISFDNPALTSPSFDMKGIELVASTSSGNLIGDGSLMDEAQSFLVTCADGRYSYFSESSSRLNYGSGVNSDTLSSNETIEHVGLFTSHVDFAGNQLISLHSAGRGTFVFNVTVSDGFVYLDQTPYQQTATSELQCG